MKRMGARHPPDQRHEPTQAREGCLDHEDTKAREEHEARRARSTKLAQEMRSATTPFVFFVLRGFVATSCFRDPDSSPGQKSVTSCASVFWHGAENFKVRFCFTYPKNPGFGV
jgi:hypothetical protein